LLQLLDLLENQPASYVRFIQTTLQFVLTAGFTTKGSQQLFLIDNDFLCLTNFE
jgi:hypothetical protein